MTLGYWLTIIGIVVTASVSFLVADLHRRQMRQIEAFRLDPSVGLIPPPHPVLYFFRDWGIQIVYGGGAIYFFVKAVQLHEPREVPATHRFVVYVALSVGGFAVAVISWLFTRWLTRLEQTIDGVFSIITRLVVVESKKKSK